MLGSFVDGLFEGAKATAALMETREKMLGNAEKHAAAKRAEALANDQATIKATFNPEGTDTVQPSTGTSTAPPADAPAEIKPPEYQASSRSTPGDPNLWPQIKPLIGKYESNGDYAVGYGVGDTTKFPDMKGFYGFPDRPSVDNSRATGFYQFQPGTWQQYARMVEQETGKAPNFRLPADQDAVAEKAYVVDGLRHWVPYNPKLKVALANERLLGGAATAAARAGAAKPPSALNMEPSADLGGGLTAPAPDLEGQRAKAASGPAAAPSLASAATAAIKALPASTVSAPPAPTMADGSAQMYAPPAVAPPTPNPVSTPSAISALTPRPDAAAAAAAMTPAAPTAPTATPPIKVETPPRPVLSQLRQQQDAPPPFTPAPGEITAPGHKGVVIGGKWYPSVRAWNLESDRRADDASKAALAGRNSALFPR
jgi:hypothetical protein